MHEGLPKSGNERVGGNDPFSFDTLEGENTVESSISSPEQDRKRADLIREINEQIPFLAYGLSEKIQQSGLGGKVSIRGIMGDSWGVGVSKNNPRKDIPNIVIYPESILSEERAVTNAQLRHEVGNLNHSIDGEKADLAIWCKKNNQNYKLISPLVEAVQEASVNYLEMRNSISDDPAAAFRPLYEKIIPVKSIAENIGSDLEYKQAVDMTLLKSLNIAGLVDSTTLDIADGNLSDDVRAAFSNKTSSVIEQAVRTSSGKIRVQLVRDYLWPEFAKLVSDSNVTSEAETEDQSKVNFNQNNNIERINRNEQTVRAFDNQRVLDIIERNQVLSPEEQNERASVSDSLLGEIGRKVDELSGQLFSLDSDSQSEENQDNEDRIDQSEEIQEQLENLQSLLDDLKNPEKASGDDLENLQFKINEIGIDESSLDEKELKLLENLREFCKSTTVTYVRTMRFIMEEYKSCNPNFTDEMMEKMILHGHDTPSFTIYGKEAGENFIENTCPELGYGDFESNGMVLNFNLPDVLGRFWYRGGNGARAQSVPDGAIEWGHLYRNGMPAIWRSVDSAPRTGIYFNRLNEFGQHDYRKYYYLYDVIGLGSKFNEQQEAENDLDGQNELLESDVDGNGESNNDTDGQSQNGEIGEGPQQDNQNGSDSGSEMGQMSGSDMEQMGDTESFDEMNGTEMGNLGDMQKQLSDMLSDLESLMSEQSSEINQALTDALSKAIAESLSNDAMSDNHSEHIDLAELFSQLQETQEKLESSFSDAKSEQGGFREYEIDDQDIEPDTVESIDNLEAIKEQQQRQLESIYREQSGLSGEALGRYIDYREDTRAFTDDLVTYFTEKFKMDTEYVYEKNQRRGNRLQRGWTSRILGRTALGATAIEPEVFERRSIPKKPQFVWSVIIDNSGSCSGDIIEEEKKTAVALTEVASRLNIPLEIVTFGGPNEYTFLKTFDQELYGDQLSRLVQLGADQSTPDVVTLNAACTSVADYADSFNRPYNFVYFMTDGESGSGSIQSVISKFKRDMVITGVGLAGAADSISSTWGKNSVGVEDVSKLSDTLIRKIEDQIEETF